MEKFSNQETIDQISSDLDQLELKILSFEDLDMIVTALTDLGYWASEMLNARILYKEKVEVFQILDRVKYLCYLLLDAVIAVKQEELYQKMKDVLEKNSMLHEIIKYDNISCVLSELNAPHPFLKDYNLDILNLSTSIKAYIEMTKDPSSHS